MNLACSTLHRGCSQKISTCNVNEHSPENVTVGADDHLKNYVGKDDKVCATGVLTAVLASHVDRLDRL